MQKLTAITNGGEITGIRIPLSVKESCAVTLSTVFFMRMLGRVCMRIWIIFLRLVGGGCGGRIVRFISGYPVDLRIAMHGDFSKPILWEFLGVGGEFGRERERRFEMRYVFQSFLLCIW